MTGRRQLLAIVVPLVVAAAVAILFLRMTAAPSPQAGASRTIVVAAGDLPAGTTLSASDLATTRVTSVLPEEATSVTDLVGHVLTVSVVKGSPVLESAAVIPSHAGVDYQVPFGLRALALSLPSPQAVNYVIQPGDRVDVLATYSAGVSGIKNTPLTQTILQDVTVLEVTPPAPNVTSGTVILLVTPQGADDVELAAHNGTIDLVLRRSGDTSTTTPPTYETGGELP